MGSVYLKKPNTMYVCRVSGAVHKVASIHMYVGVDDNIAILKQKPLNLVTKTLKLTFKHPALILKNFCNHQDLTIWASISEPDTCDINE